MLQCLYYLRAFSLLLLHFLGKLNVEVLELTRNVLHLHFQVIFQSIYYNKEFLHLPELIVLLHHLH